MPESLSKILVKTVDENRHVLFYSGLVIFAGYLLFFIALPAGLDPFYVIIVLAAIALIVLVVLHAIGKLSIQDKALKKVLIGSLLVQLVSGIGVGLKNAFYEPKFSVPLNKLIVFHEDSFEPIVLEYGKQTSNKHSTEKGNLKTLSIDERFMNAKRYIQLDKNSNKFMISSKLGGLLGYIDLEDQETRSSLALFIRENANSLGLDNEHDIPIEDKLDSALATICPDDRQFGEREKACMNIFLECLELKPDTLEYRACNNSPTNIDKISKFFFNKNANISDDDYLTVLSNYRRDNKLEMLYELSQLYSFYMERIKGDSISEQYLSAVFHSAKNGIGYLTESNDYSELRNEDDYQYFIFLMKDRLKVYLESIGDKNKQGKVKKILNYLDKARSASKGDRNTFFSEAKSVYQDVFM